MSNPTTRTESLTSVGIRPGVSILSILQHLNYKPWYAMAEFVDNSLQSFLANGEILSLASGSQFTPRVDIELDDHSGRIVIRDNAAGISIAEFARAFRPAEVPVNRSGLSEFGMGMKSAACWFANKWSVRTSAIGEPVERTVSFDIERIVEDNLEELQIETREVSASHHYTEITLLELNQVPRGRTIGKMKSHLASIYRTFLRSGDFDLFFDGECLEYSEPAVLTAPFFRDLTGPSLHWRKDIDLDFGLGWRIYGFAALRNTASLSTAGFALFRRGRLIQGSGEDAYRPETIFGKPNSYVYQRLFGEFAVEGFEVSHTKDGFRWEDHEDLMLEELRKELDSEPLPLLKQADGHRARQHSQHFVSEVRRATEHTADTIEREAAPVIESQIADPISLGLDEPPLPPVESMVSTRTINLVIDGRAWTIEIELSNDPGIGEWVSAYDTQVRREDRSASRDDELPRTIGIRLALAHPFMQRFGGTEREQIEPLLRIAVAIELAVITARDSGVRYSAEVRHRVNELLRDVLSKP